MDAKFRKRNRLAAIVIAVLISLSCMCGLSVTQAHASAGTLGDRILAEAQTRAGDWYVYGAAGPSSFDCSGLVYWTARQFGINLPRTTYGMLASWHLVRTWHPAAGDLAFYGPGHVELVSHGHDVTWGALHAGTRLGPHQWNQYWHPTEYFEVRVG